MIWFKDSIINGLQALVALRLRNTPSAETLPAVAKIWMAALQSRPVVWREDLDRERINRAFLTIAATTTHWPSPAEFMAVMQPRNLPVSLPAPVDRNMSPATRKMVDDLLVRMRRNVTQ